MAFALIVLKNISLNTICMKIQIKTLVHFYTIRKKGL